MNQVCDELDWVIIDNERQHVDANGAHQLRIGVRSRAWYDKASGTFRLDLEAREVRDYEGISINEPWLLFGPQRVFDVVEDAPLIDVYRKIIVQIDAYGEAVRRCYEEKEGQV